MSESLPTSPMPPPLGALPPAGPDLTGRTLKDFHVLRRLGQGGMGQVYLAEQLSLKRKVALKVLRPDLAADPVALQRFKAEAEAVARITHGNIVQVYAHDEADGVQFIALEYVEGKTLREYLAKKGPPDVLLAVSLMRQMAAALQRAGEMGIVHRDVKPDNILLTRRGEVKVADFGLSRCLDGGRPAPNLTQSGTTMGTPLYMSPEQVEGKPLDPRTDIYSLGVTCYHMLSGQPPFRGETAFEVALQHVRDEPVPLRTIRTDLPEALCAIVHKMMAKDPAQRYQTGRELYRDLTRLREGLSGTTAALSPPMMSVELVPASTPTASTTLHAMPAGQRRLRWRPVLVALSLVAALAAGAVTGWVRRHTTPPLAPGVTPPPGEAELTRDTPQKHEQALRGLVEGALNSPSRDNIQEVFPLCRQLGLYYLAAGRLDEANGLFTRLSQIKQVPEYQVLGLYGQAIVRALRSQPKESNELFGKAVRTQQALARGQRQKLVILRQELWQKPKWRYWVHKALDYNEKNDPTLTPPKFIVQRLYT